MILVNNLHRRHGSRWRRRRRRLRQDRWRLCNSRERYRNGDLNFSGGSPNSDDYFQIDKAFYNQGAALSAAVGPAADAGLCGIIGDRLADADKEGDEETREACGSFIEYRDFTNGS